MSAKRTVEIEDTLDDRIESAKDDIAAAFTEFRESNPDRAPSKWEPHDLVFEIADGAVPIYTSEIRGLWYLYSNDFEAAYRDAGIGDGTEDNHEQVAIFSYIEARLWEHVRELQKDAEDE